MEIKGINNTIHILEKEFLSNGCLKSEDLSCPRGKFQHLDIMRIDDNGAPRGVG
jgi:hypothetical protein